ncbi:hypothetical protein [Spiroplasma endosymbiont of Villa modesta]|uniref:hypothetical protein n=1 Tax=Spiroplasma endosymbiont of Villa modesta TaxID=3066293 RepID=UPI00313C3230
MKKILLLLAISNTLSMTNSNFSYNINSSLTNTIKSNDEINFLATADIHAGYPQLVTKQLVSLLNIYQKIIIEVLLFLVI